MSGNQLVCIKRPEPGLSAVFEEMYLNERLVDVTLSCSDGQLQAHKLVLAACSSYFSSLFDKLANPFHYPVIVIKDMQIEDLKLIVDFMYRGQLTISQDRLMSLISSAENLQINGLSNVEEIVSNVEPKDGMSSNNGSSSNNISTKLLQRFKKGKKSSSSNLIQHHGVFNRTYQSRQDDIEAQLNPHPNKLLEQSMITMDSIDDNNQFSSYANDPTSTRNLNNNSNNQQQLHNPSPSTIHIQHLSNIDQQQHHQQQLSNQLQVLSHSLAVNRSSLSQASANNISHQQSSQAAQQQTRGRMHPCNQCWKTFREKANLKRHLQVHSMDRVVYVCPECNKSFSWKDNYIRHKKTAHHINHSRPTT